MESIVGTWSGEISGTNRGFFLIEVSAQNGNLVGTARINEPALGVSLFTLDGTGVQLRLSPVASVPPGLMLGIIDARIEKVEGGVLEGTWQSTIGTAGFFRATRQQPTKPKSKKIFVVHGHDEAARESVARFLERLDLMPIILFEQTSQGDTVMEKLERHSDAGYAVILLTPDDEGHPIGRPNEKAPRARQNVILELGFFMGKLGRRNVCPLYKGSWELPSDYHGVVYVEMDAAGGWRLNLAGELRGAGFNIDVNRLLPV